jgi:hypothetical protein
MKQKTLLILVLGFITFGFNACGSGGSLTVYDVVGIAAGDKDGTGLTAEYSTTYEITSDGCKDFPALEIDPEGAKKTIDVIVVQDLGAISFDGIEGILRGGIEFSGDFEVGAAIILSRSGDDNIEQLIRVKGKFGDPNTYDGEGEARYQGRVQGAIVDCSITFKISGIRKGS